MGHRLKQEHIDDLLLTLTEFFSMSTTLEEIGVQLGELKAAIAAIAVPVTPTVDLSGVLAAIADLKTEIQSNVEGTAPDSAPAA